MTEFLNSLYSVNSKGHLMFGGSDTIELAKEYGTPLYVMDEEFIRERMQLYKSELASRFGGLSLPYFASKAFSIKRIYEIAAEEGIGCDAVSSGELYTIISAGFPCDKVIFHGNNKTDFDIKYGVENHVGYFAADNREELDILDSTAAKSGIKQKIMLRLSPGIDPHTHKKIITGSVDSKFGTAISTGQAMEITKYALTKHNLQLCGFHCHIGSQILDSQPFVDASSNMLGFIAEVKRELGFETQILNLGGGYGVRYIPEHREINYRNILGDIEENINNKCADYNIRRPDIMLEPGRSVVADAGITLYTVGSVKEITGFLNYVSIDGGMPDNPRYALYSSPYTISIANRANDKADYKCTVAGRCCESGDLIAEGIYLQRCVRGDILAVHMTGAYNYSMSSNYNRIPRPPVVMLKNGKPYTALKRESFEDLIRCDL